MNNIYSIFYNDVLDVFGINGNGGNANANANVKQFPLELMVN